MERAELARLLGVFRSQVSDLAYSSDAVVIEERDPARFQAAFAAAVAGSGPVFLADPDWGAAERDQFQKLVVQHPTSKLQPSTSKEGPMAAREKSEMGEPEFGARMEGRSQDDARGESHSKIQNPNSKIELGWLCIPTGGSSGRLKLARHDQDTLLAAAWGFAGHFGVPRVNAVGVLPLHHVSGLMAWLRCALTGGEYVAGDWREIEAGALPAFPRTDDGWFLSLVPTQLQRLLARPAAVAWLRAFRAVLVGGGPAWPALVEAGARAELPLAFTYGATETAAAAMALRPEEFRAGGRGCGRALPHATVTVAADGAIAIQAASLFHGYWPDVRAPGPWASGDRGDYDGAGSLHVRGRSDALIITGGEKVEPGEVEAALRATGEFADVAVVGVPDPEWGRVVVACYPETGGVGAPRPHGPDSEPDWARVAAGLVGLAAWKRPKRFVALVVWPRDAAGKIDREELARVAGEKDCRPAARSG